ncbi:protein kinase [Candidatus Uabimicrobium sp. HlEnr_7]|uniref:protein kinase domain-containing protein n=1 Tax=Candidatus Uabimicrobium helgolandensis TaxID=3095367 RepID=UPI00355776C6
MANIGKYRVIKVLGRGGMGQVLQVYDPEFQRTLALKVIIGKQNQKSLKRFQREARLNATLEHNNIAKIYNFFFHDNQACIVMQYISGQSLSKFCKSQNLQIEQRLQLMYKIIKAIGYAHKKGVLHRDLKPDNIIVSATGEPFILDFGIAKTYKIEDETLTKTGEVLGTPRYMSPEQISGFTRKLDIRSDIYSLGVILYEIIVGERFVKSQTTLTILNEVLNKKPRFNRSSKIPHDVQAIYLRALEKKVNRRYQTTQQMAEDIKKVLEGKVNTSSRLYLLRKSSLLRVILLLSIVVILTFVVYRYISKRAPQNELVIQEYRSNISFEEQEWLNVKLLMQIKSYEVAWQKLQRILQNPIIYKTKLKNYKDFKDNLHVYYMVSLVGVNRYEDAKRYYNQLSTKEQQNISCKLAMAKAYYFLGNTDTAKLELQQLQRKKLEPMIIQNVHYWLGKIAVDQDQYKEAIFHFEKISSREYPFVHFYLGICYFKRVKQEGKLINKAELHLKKAQSLNLPKIYRYLGQIYLDKQPKNALRKFKKCIELEPYNGTNYYWTAVAYEKLKQYKKAFHFYNQSFTFQTKKAADALTGFMRVAAKDVTISDKLLSYPLDMFHKNNFSTPKLVDIQIRKIIRDYQNDFLKWQSQKNSKENIEVFIQKTQSSEKQVRQLSLKALVSLRYHSRIKTLIKQQIRKKNDKDLFTILQDVRQAEKAILCYKMAQLYLQIPTYKETKGIEQLYRKDIKGKETSVLLQDIMQNVKQKPILRYLASITHYIAFGKKSLKKNSIISCCVIKKLNILYPQSIKIDHVVFLRAAKKYLQNQNDEWLTLLLASQLDDKHLLQQLLDNGKLPSLIAASKLWLGGNSQQKLPSRQLQKVQTILETYLKDSSPLVRAYSHFCLLQPISVNQVIAKNYFSIIKNGLLDQDNLVKKATLSSLFRYFNISVEKVTLMLLGNTPKEILLLREHLDKTLMKLLYNCDDPVIQQYVITYLSVIAGTKKNFDRYFKKFISDINNSPFLRTAALVQLLRLPTSWKVTLTDISFDSKIIDEMKKITMRDEIEDFRITTLGFLTLYGINVIDCLQNEKSTNVQAFTLLFSGIKNYRVKFPTNKKRDLKVITGFLKSSSSNIRTAAASGYVIYNWNNDNIVKIFSKITNKMISKKDIYLRKGAAIGGYIAFQDHLFSCSKYFEALGSFAERYPQIYMKIFQLQLNRKNPQRDQNLETYRKFFQTLIKLDPTVKYPEEDILGIKR